MSSVSEIINRAAPPADPRRAPNGAPRPKIEWTDAKVFEGKQVKVTVSMSAERFPKFSLRVGGGMGPHLRASIERGSFNTPSMMNNALALAEEAKALLLEAGEWINSKLAEDHAENLSNQVARDESNANKPAFGAPKAPRVTGKTERDREKKKNRA